MTTLLPDSHPQDEFVLLSLLQYAPTLRNMEMVDQLNRVIKLLALTGK